MVETSYQYHYNKKKINVDISLSMSFVFDISDVDVLEYMIGLILYFGYVYWEKPMR